MSLLIMLLSAGPSWPWCVSGCSRVVDRRLNQKATAPATETVGNLPLGAILGLMAAVLIGVVNQLGIHPAIAGWILGFVTSLPEMVTFYAIYSRARMQGTSHLDDDTQEALDNLAASNMTNAGMIYPLGWPCIC